MINLNNSGFRIILASQSPRRQFLLHETGLEFEVLVKPTDESFPPELKAHEIAQYVSVQKAMAFNFDELSSDTLLITADTIVLLDGKIIGKPADSIEAKEILTRLSGRNHTVCTGICFRTAKKIHSFYVNTEVYFRELEEHEIDYYIEHYKPFDKAGAYGVQEWIGYVGVERIEGSYFNVMGLPVQRVYIELKKFMESH